MQRQQLFLILLQVPRVLKAACSVQGSFTHDETVSYGQYVCISRIMGPNASPAWLQGRVQFTMFKTVIWGQKLKWLQSASRVASTCTKRWAAFAPAVLQKQRGRDGAKGKALWGARIRPPASDASSLTTPVRLSIGGFSSACRAVLRTETRFLLEED